MIKSVSAIFGNEAKVKIMRLFIFNPDTAYRTVDIINRVKENPRLVRKQLNELFKAGLLRKRSGGFILEKSYPYLNALDNFLTDIGPISDKDLIKKISKAGTIKLLIVSGLFIHDPESRVDLLVVGDHIKKGKLLSAIANTEAELGREIRYAAFETADFRYRLGMYDKLIRDILDFKHRKAINKLGV